MFLAYVFICGFAPNGSIEDNCMFSTNRDPIMSIEQCVYIVSEVAKSVPDELYVVTADCIDILPQEPNV